MEELLTCFKESKIRSKLPSDYPPSYREFLQSYGNLLITELWICKKPIQKAFDQILNIISFGNWQKKKDELNYDNMFHLFAIAKLATNQYVLFEKNQVLNIQMVDRNYFRSAKTIFISNYRTVIPFNLNTMHQRCLELIGPEEMFLYRGDSTNCQHFIYNMFKASQLMNKDIEGFVMQDAKSLVASMPNVVQKFINGATDIAGFFDHLLYGAALMNEANIRKLRKNKFGGSSLFL